MGISPFQPAYNSDSGSVRNAGNDRPSQRGRRGASSAEAVSFSARAPEYETAQHHAELFYLQKQIQSQTPMVVVLEDGERIEGCIEWYDRNSVKVRGRTKNLIYKSAIKYMYKLGDVG